MKGTESGNSPGSALRFEVGIGTDDFSPDNGVGGYCPYVSKETRLSGSPSVKDLVSNVPLNLESFDRHSVSHSFRRYAVDLAAPIFSTTPSF